MSERMSFRLSKRATLLALMLACPFAALATWTWLDAADAQWYEQDDIYVIGDMIYACLGYPLTRIFFVFRPSRQVYVSDFWWALPLLNLLFFVQWVIWAQLLALVWRALKQLCRRLVGGFAVVRE